jgi:hypothetical protein
MLLEREANDYRNSKILRYVSKGFGFIEPEDGSNDAFVHATALERAGVDRPD